VGIGILGAVLVFFVGLMLVIRRKKQRQHTTSIIAKSATAFQAQDDHYERLDDVKTPPPPLLMSYVIKSTYTPTLSDELEIQPGDRVTVLQEYDDGWVQGVNNSRGGEKGVFPKHCLDLESGLTDKRSSSVGLGKFS